MLKIMFFLIGFGLSIIGFMYIIMYLNYLETEDIKLKEITEKMKNSKPTGLMKKFFIIMLVIENICFIFAPKL